MTGQKKSGVNVEYLMGMLASADGMIRMQARKSLVGMGKASVPALIQALQPVQPDQVRWEAAKSLGAIGDVRSIPALVRALEDNDSDVAWLAAEALRRFKKAAWPPLFRFLITDGSESARLRQSAYYVLQNQDQKGLNGTFAALLRALNTVAEPESAPVAAHAMLEMMKTHS
jgi:HEAT repeat protein